MFNEQRTFFEIASGALDSYSFDNIIRCRNPGTRYRSLRTDVLQVLSAATTSHKAASLTRGLTIRESHSPPFPRIQNATSTNHSIAMGHRHSQIFAY